VCFVVALHLRAAGLLAFVSTQRRMAMRFRCVVIARVMVAAAILGLPVALAMLDPPVTYAAPAPVPLALTAPIEGAKVTLAETSVDGPALWTLPSGAANGQPRVILAWTGADSQHHLNYMSSTDGLHYDAKHILTETSPFRPSVTEIVNVAGGAQFIVLAWTGTDPQHTVNVLYIDASTSLPVTKLTLSGDTSLSAPAVAARCCGATSELRLAWAGTDSQRTLHVLRISAARQVTGTTTLSGYGSLAAPSLNDASPVFDTWLLSWTDLNQRLNFAESDVNRPDTWVVRPRLAEFSGAGPSMIEVPVSSVPSGWLAWSGTFRDTAHHLNVLFTQSFAAIQGITPTGAQRAALWCGAEARGCSGVSAGDAHMRSAAPNEVANKTTFVETCLGGPELGDLGVSGQTLVAWTGMDVARSLNVALILVASTR
jgi:hypothetical protein